jgi:hypothetical protein
METEMKPLPLYPLVVASLPFAALAQEAGNQGGSAEEIARKLADPGAAMVSVPFQYNYLGEVGPGGDFDNQVLKIQPVIPFVGEHGKFLLRPILPLLSNKFPRDESGVGDLFVQGYYIPHREGAAVEVGYGPAVVFDTASDDSLGSGKWSIGPAFVFIHKTNDHKWTMSALVNHIWSVAGDEDRQDVSQTSLQPILARSFPQSWTMTLSSESSYNWHADSGDAWTVPLGVSVSKVVKLGDHPVSFSLGGFYAVERPEFANKWSARFTVTLVYPE